MSDNTDKFIRAFWRRIYRYRNKYGKELPEKIPVEFRANCETAMIWLRKDADPVIQAFEDQIAELTDKLAEANARAEGD